ncbi:hypothetical protein [Gelidibacter sp.]|uniref:hypothetical protein n=1 Tax=Gelidibacter sp. TaxID=2018083 RepID=UPI003266478F
MKKVILLILMLNCGIGFAQKDFPFFEQIAFDFYRTKLLDSFPIQKKIKVFPYVNQFHTSGISNPICLGIDWKNNNQFQELDSYTKSQYNIDSNRYELDFRDLDKRKFKIKRNGNGNFPKLYISPPNTEGIGTDKIYVDINEAHKNKTVIYHFEFNKKGEIKDWCKEVNEIIRIE